MQISIGTMGNCAAGSDILKQGLMLNLPLDSHQIIATSPCFTGGGGENWQASL